MAHHTAMLGGFDDDADRAEALRTLQENYQFFRSTNPFNAHFGAPEDLVRRAYSDMPRLNELFARRTIIDNSPSVISHSVQTVPSASQVSQQVLHEADAHMGSSSGRWKYALLTGAAGISAALGLAAFQRGPKTDNQKAADIASADSAVATRVQSAAQP